MINLLLETAPAAGGGSTWIMIAILAVFFVLMIVMTIIPQRKQKKKMAEMFNSLSVGDKIMTIGGFVGVITEIDAPNDKYIINIGTEENPVNVTVIKNAIRTRM
ncbi:MAG TPA: preprotein translocase subunit YajC [Clostridia bacterium]|jgi:preprotein translocase subunit YajC|nr:preprotein translocase subunit YajC [Clostridia bacterium]